ncbi:methyl-accepting chemotaxis protein [Spartinivicinus poritis]|uniref:Methyl-accepting chemotaxis protein n=1 Tax=Spartinivicinus poritis TaxID=2994640 RepID=A0ABT5UG38_9GAMM|nr:methyl-accepting chemotaxis protein [Spartinivicinus sp. A2-2]MDE1465165.1 methyl-accepting chemotaxis protein [Spartinivicinus sp. A2-2]
MLHLKHKILLIAIVPVIVITVLISVISYISTGQLVDDELNNFRKTLFEEKKAELKGYLDMTKTAISHVYNSTADSAKEDAFKIIRQIRYGDNGYIFSFQYDGLTVVHGAKPELEGKNLIDLKDPNGVPLIKLLSEEAQKGGGYVEYQWDKPGSKTPEPKLSYAIPLEKWQIFIGTGFYIDGIDKTISEQRSKAEAAKQQTLITILGVGTAAVVILGFCSILLTNSITSPIRETVELMCDISEGEGDLTKRLKNSGQSEMGKLAEAFNTFVAKLQGIIKKVAEASSHINKSSSEINTVVQDNSKQMNAQASETEQVATAINEMSLTAQEIAASATQAADEATNAQTSALKGNDVVINTINSIASLADQLQEAEKVMDALGNETENIGSVLGVIGSIAEQTNLLALNAAIEAARAGEQGRGFAVVADEVRTLASRTQSSTQEIHEMITRLQQQSSTAVKVMKVSRELSDSTSRQAEEAGESLTAIKDSIGVITEMNHQIATASEEQTSVIEEINKNITRIADAVSEMSHGMEATSNNSNRLHAMGQELNSLVKQFRV